MNLSAGKRRALLRQAANTHVSGCAIGAVGGGGEDAGARWLYDGFHYLSWMDCIYPYVKNLALFDCPSRQPPVTPAFAVNGWLAGVYGGAAAQSLAGVQNPASKLWLVHNLGIYGYANHTDWAWWASDEYRRLDPAGAQRMFPHNDGANILFVDGHAKWASRTDRRYALLEYYDPALPVPGGGS